MSELRHAEPRSAYVHVPFCVSKCHYCDFNSRAGGESLFPRYVDAVVREIESAPACSRALLDTAYFGGGTPTVLPAPMIERILTALDRKFGFADGAEITIEANPGTIGRIRLRELRSAGFSRISLGVQSFDDGFLSLIGRVHNARQAVEALRAARAAGFGNVSLDLIFALPGQSVSHWGRTLDAAIALAPDHISTYELTVEDGTVFAYMAARGQLCLPSEDEQVEMYELACEKLEGAGFEHYEVSNFALPGFRCRHNVAYWRSEPYLAFGAGATSFMEGVRAKRLADPADYIRAVETGNSFIESSECLAGRAKLAEMVMQGLRMLEGIPLDGFRQRTGFDLCNEFRTEIENLAAAGLLEMRGGRLRVTRRGLLLLNDVAAEFLP